MEPLVHQSGRIGRCPTCGGTTLDEPYSCQGCIDAIPDPALAYEPPYTGDEPLGTCPIHGDYWTDDCMRCGR
jgi:hypothetical protein